MGNINSQINILENQKLFKELEKKNRRAENDRRYYLKNIERLIKNHMIYNNKFEKHNEISNLHGRIR